jgi:hypothetical protein
VQRVPVRTVGRAWRRLDEETRLSFLSALWAARGFETRVTDGRVSAARDGRVAVIVPSADPGPGDARAADALVTVRPDGRSASPGARGRPHRAGEPRHLTARDLRRLLLYAVDRGDGERLAREYLDLSLTVPDGWRGGGEGRLRRAADRARRAATPAAVAAVVLVLAGVAGAVVVGGDASIAGPSLRGAGGLDGGDAGPKRADGGTGPTDPTSTRGAGSAGASGPNGTAGGGGPSEAVGALGATGGSDRGPGLDPARPVSAERLAAAHAEAVAGETYGLRVWATGLPATAVADATPVAGWAERDRPVESALWVFVENGSVYRGYLEASLANGGGPATAGLRYETYAEGGSVWHRRSTGNDWRVWHDPSPGPRAEREDRFARLAARYVERYLATTAVVVREREGEAEAGDDGPFATAATGEAGSAAAGYRVVARGEPTALEAVMPSYRAEATVRPDGLVTRLEVEYYVRDEDDDDGGRWVGFGFEYVDAGRASVSEPAWVRAAAREDGPGAGGSDLACTTADVASGLCTAASGPGGETTRAVTVERPVDTAQAWFLSSRPEHIP